MREEVTTLDIIKDLDEVIVELARRGYSPTLSLHHVEKRDIPSELSPDIMVFTKEEPPQFLGFFSRFKKLVPQAKKK